MKLTTQLKHLAKLIEAMEVAGRIKSDTESEKKMERIYPKMKSESEAVIKRLQQYLNGDSVAK